MDGTPHRTARRLSLLLGLLVLVIVTVPASTLYRRYSDGKACASCHEIWQPYREWHSSAHRNIACSACHGDVFSADAGFHVKNMLRLVSHWRGMAPEQIQLRPRDLVMVNDRCGGCHQQERAAWSASRHSASYSRIFLDAQHNRRQALADDCLRCHGMYFQGSIRDLVVAATPDGPWVLRDPALASQPAILCLTCHQLHRQGPILRPSLVKNSSLAEEIHRPSVGLFDRREQAHVPLDDLPLPQIREGARLVQISRDRRQALCYQCHAPVANNQVNSGDDRTPVGIHEGLSCLACHQKHGQQSRASCATCHPQLSNCGLDVEQMDTTFKSTKSPHNIHFVKCRDCHTNGVPRRKQKTRTAQAAL